MMEHRLGATKEDTLSKSLAELLAQASKKFAWKDVSRGYQI